MPKFPAVERRWPGETFVCIASGPSLTREDVEAVRGRARVIVVNNNIQIAPWADVLYAADAGWWKWATRGQSPMEAFPALLKAHAGLKYSVTSQAARYHCVTVLGRGPSEGLSLDPTKLCLGANGGYQAINLAVLLGAARIVLLGYDMQLGPKGQRHWHRDHPSGSFNAPLQNFRQKFPTLVEPLQRAGVEVINCSRQTALTCFPRQSIEDVFPRQTEAVA